VLPAGNGPEGGVAIPQRNLAVVASEKDDRGDKIRAVINIYHRALFKERPFGQGPSSANWMSNFYPTITSAADLTKFDVVPIPFGALSGLCAGAIATTLYTIEDSAYGASRFFELDTSTFPAVLTKATHLVDSNDVFASMATYGQFSAADLAAMIRLDKKVNIDPEGIAYIGPNDEFLIAHEGSGTVDDVEKPVESLNMLFRVDPTGVILEVITLPDALNDKQLRFGFEGVAVDNGVAIVAFQRKWDNEPNPRIGMYDMTTKTWTFVYYPLDAPESQNGGWVGLSDITALGNSNFVVLERDNQGGPDAAIKRIYQLDLSLLMGVPFGQTPPTVTKTLVKNLLPDLKALTNGPVYEKVEGLAVTADKGVWLLNDNDAVDDNNGEIGLFKIDVPLIRTFTITGDPHVVGAHGDAFSFRGVDGAVYALLSAARLAFNARFRAITFAMGGACAKCTRKTVHGSFIMAAYFNARTAANKSVHVSYLADSPSRAQLTISEAPTGKAASLLFDAAIERELTVSIEKPDAIDDEIDDVTVGLRRKHSREATVTVRNAEFELAASSRFLGWAEQNGHKKRLDVSIVPLKDVARSEVAPHGLIGQTFDGDGVAIDGAIDDYSPAVVYTKAMGEGAIEGIAGDYEIAADDPYSPAFKFSRFAATKAAARDTAKLSGVHRVVGKNVPMMATTQGDDQAIELA